MIIIHSCVEKFMIVCQDINETIILGDKLKSNDNIFSHGLQIDLKNGNLLEGTGYLVVFS